MKWSERVATVSTVLHGSFRARAIEEFMRSYPVSKPEPKSLEIERFLERYPSRRVADAVAKRKRRSR